MHIVVFETDGASQAVRIIPFMDIEGGRLNYLRNDLLYFRHSGLWQRSSITEKFENGNTAHPSEYTKRLIHQVVELDACLTGLNAPRFYYAKIFVRQMVPTSGFWGWTPAVETAHTSVYLNNQDMIRLRKKCPYAFNLPPGHFFEKQREKETMTRLGDIKTEKIEGLYTSTKDLLLPSDLTEYPVSPISETKLVFWNNEGVQFVEPGQIIIKEQANSIPPYLIKIEEEYLKKGSYFIAQGKLFEGGFTLELRQNENLASSVDISDKGAFTAIIEVPVNGLYSLTLRRLSEPTSSPRNHFSISKAGWIEAQYIDR
jgi:hypothetical protein